MMNHYCVMDEDGLYRIFDVSHDGLEDAIEFAQKIGSEVLREDDAGEDEVVWTPAGDVDHPATREVEPSEDNFRNDAEADADTLAMAGSGTDEDYGCYDSGDEDWGAYELGCEV
jgi:hypothetical protein